MAADALHRRLQDSASGLSIAGIDMVRGGVCDSRSAVAFGKGGSCSMGTATRGIPRQLQVRQREWKLHAGPSPLGSVGSRFCPSFGPPFKNRGPLPEERYIVWRHDTAGSSLAWGKGVLSQTHTRR